MVGPMQADGPAVGLKMLWCAWPGSGTGDGHTPPFEGIARRADNAGYVYEAGVRLDVSQLYGVSSAIRWTGCSAIRLKISVK